MFRSKNKQRNEPFNIPDAELKTYMTFYVFWTKFEILILFLFLSLIKSVDYNARKENSQFKEVIA